jgi:hypothetical protein
MTVVMTVVVMSTMVVVMAVTSAMTSTVIATMIAGFSNSGHGEASGEGQGDKGFGCVFHCSLLLKVGECCLTLSPAREREKCYRTSEKNPRKHQKSTKNRGKTGESGGEKYLRERDEKEILLY